ncbi:early boundary activity protein 2-like isoform X2 [Pectinophora gossypiella]|uniref:early boundary activity protein 2-like isoform X2 n=1 Tax=Pectinophora gossypiella TaxID=13191 RepID=UPI00214F4488|nr:early boundary activity protein 2-like isoform X2 [Pectinophora gossypiella]
MSRNHWLLVEWVDERNVFPCYGVVNADSLVNEEPDLHPGKMIFVRAKHGNSARRAQILRISDDKRHVKEHKLLLERQDHQVKNMLSLCMRTIKEMKTDPLIFGSFNANQQSVPGVAGGSGAAPIHDDSDSDSDSDGRINEDLRSLPLINSTVKTLAQYKRIESPPVVNNMSSTIQSASQKKRSIGTIQSSTPLPQSNIVKEIPKLTFDQATQTDDTQVQVPVEKIEQMETILNQLHEQFLALVGRLQLDCPESSIYNSDAENREREISDRENYAEVSMSRADRSLNQPKIEPEDLRRNVKSPQVRRVSAQTTNNVEPPVPANRNDMVPIGSGHATVPARLMNEINWGSYSSATRQLLQAVFPRKVLATHSLTGKQSPAFTNKPAKKCLDPKLIDDIVDTVADRCGVPKRSVRNCITIKCTDEAKLYRNRMLGRNSGQMPVTTNQDNRENVPPSPISRESSNGTPTD